MARKVNKAQKVRDYLSANPDAKAKEIATALKITPQYVHQVLHKMKPRKVLLTINDVKIAKSLGVPIEVYAKEKGLSFKTRMQSAVERLAPTIPTEEEIAKANEIRKDIVAQHHTDMVNHPPHYKAGGIETIDFIEAKELDYHLGNVIKYVSRADHKGNKLEDLKKAQWYLARAIEKLV
jgi:Protein of unknwon function (DUF3310)